MENGKKVMFPGETAMGEYGEINDISGIVNETSAIEDTSFQITIDTFNKRLGNVKPRNLQINTCKLAPSKSGGHPLFPTHTYI